ncbi:MAG TPA: hypothetical protein IAB98_11180 [Candidatus Egerieimonas intestinavium]|uniref:Uncharacterized protein n=1 Tax=Candidatus Egerieimonas intestinavium TaxID=2840777 RepID=A0A9D1ELP6_9FIRM|nr:hypothetical protein [Candidatus Egerieimonas intestinavium]
MRKERNSLYEYQKITLIGAAILTAIIVTGWLTMDKPKTYTMTVVEKGYDHLTCEDESGNIYLLRNEQVEEYISLEQIETGNVLKVTGKRYDILPLAGDFEEIEKLILV